MKRILMTASILIPALATFSAQAEPDFDKEQMAKKRFEEVDLNGDGMISKAEHEEAKSSKFAEGDANGDGALSYEEALAMFKNREASGPRNRKGPVGGRMFAVLDIDGDGVVSFEEFSVMGDKRHTQMDANLDGNVTFLEAQAAAKERMMEHHKKRR